MAGQPGWRIDPRGDTTIRSGEVHSEGNPLSVAADQVSDHLRCALPVSTTAVDRLSMGGVGEIVVSRLIVEDHATTDEHTKLVADHAGRAVILARNLVPLGCATATIKIVALKKCIVVQPVDLPGCAIIETRDLHLPTCEEAIMIVTDGPARKVNQTNVADNRRFVRAGLRIADLEDQHRKLAETVSRDRNRRQRMMLLAMNHHVPNRRANSASANPTRIVIHPVEKLRKIRRDVVRKKKRTVAWKKLRPRDELSTGIEGL